jgi:hypothetical protein
MMLDPKIAMPVGHQAESTDVLSLGAVTDASA